MSKRDESESLEKAETLPPELHGLLDPKHDSVSRWYKTMIENGCVLPTASQKLSEAEIARRKEDEILVVGAGIAGLVAATFLKNSGYQKVTILEANTRVGGRCKTFRNTPPPECYDKLQKRYPPTPKRYFASAKSFGEAGAMRFPKSHHLVMQLIEYVGLGRHMQEFYGSNEKFKPGEEGQNSSRILCINYRWIKWHDYEKARGGRSDLLGYGRTPSEWRSSAQDLLEEALRSDPTVERLFCIQDKLATAHDSDRAQLEDELRQQWLAVIQEHDPKSMRQFLKLRKLSPGAIEMIGVIENLESRMPLSFIHSLKTKINLGKNQEFKQIEGGTDRLPRELFKKLIDGEDWLGCVDGSCPRAVFNQRLTGIQRFCKSEDPEDGIAVAVETRIVDTDDFAIRSRDEGVQQTLQMKRFDQVIMTIPFSSLRMVKISSRVRRFDGQRQGAIDPFTAGKRRAIRQLHYDAATKVLLEFKHAFWEDGEYLGGFSVTDMPNRFLYYPSAAPEGNPVLLASYSWADDARRWDSMSEMERFRVALETVAIVHGSDKRTYPRIDTDPQVKRIMELAIFDGTSPLGAATVSWATNPNAFGEAAVLEAGQLSSLWKHITKSEWSARSGRDNADANKLIHFAGDHTSQKSAWVEGAVESGIRAALLVHGEDPYKPINQTARTRRTGTTTSVESASTSQQPRAGGSINR